MSYTLVKIFLEPIIKSFIRNIYGLENLPKKGTYIAAANHTGFADDVFLPSIFINNTKKNFTIFVNSRFYKNFFLSVFLHHYHCIPVDVSKDVKNKKTRDKTNSQAFKLALKRIKEGNVFCIFPEGGRSLDGKLMKAKIGVAKIALTAKIPVVPIGIIGSYEMMPKGAKFPKFRRVDIKIGKPISFAKYYGKEKDYKTLETVTRTIMKDIAKLINQKYNY